MRIIALLFLLVLSTACGEFSSPELSETPFANSLDLDLDNIIRQADEFLTRDVVTVTAFVAERSAGSPHDYYSEGRYWWPDEYNPDGPYIRRDGHSNPQNFVEHKKALRNFSDIVTTLTTAYELTKEKKYALRAIDHLKAWFMTPATMMNPHLRYGQAIKGISTGRGIGIIDTLKLINVALSAILLQQAGLLKDADLSGVMDWFGAYGDWLTTSLYGDDSKNNNNNHSTWWGAQVAAFGLIAGRPDLMAIARGQFMDQAPTQLAVNGSLPDEMGRTKPFHYMNYNLRGWATYAMLLGDQDQSYWNYRFNTDLPSFAPEDNAASYARKEPAVVREISLRDAVDFALPYFRQPGTWSYSTTLEPKALPHRNDFLVFASWGYNDPTYIDLWKTLETKERESHANLILWQKITGNE